MEQQTKTFIGWFSIILISLIPIFLFFTLGSGAQGFSNFSDSLYTLGRIFALIGITLFALNFVLSTRLNFLEKIFGGLDKVYLVHGIVGGIAFMLILAHPLFIVANLIPNNIVTAAGYFIPGGILSLDFGLIAIVGLLSLIFITFFTKIKYNKWKFTHEFMGLVFLFAVIHILLVDDSVAIDNIFIGYKFFALAVSAIGLGAFSYSLIIRKKFLKYANYKIKEIKFFGDTTELSLEPSEGQKSINYQAGQFVFLRFYNKEISKESHPFSIASKDNERIIKIILKKSGDFTSKLNLAKEGDNVTIEGPYGRFNFKNFENKKQVWIAGGIGITPFLGMIEELKENPDYEIEFYYTFKTNFIITKKMQEEFEKIKNLKFIIWNSEKKGHLTVKNLIENDTNLKDKEFLICGPVQFKEEIIKELKKIEIKKRNIHEEVFDLK